MTPYLQQQMSTDMCSGKGSSSNDCILAAGGAGYVGSHTVVELISAGYLTVIVDNLCNSSFGELFNLLHFCGTLQLQSYAIVIRCLSVCLSAVTRVYCDKTTANRIMWF